MTHSIKLSITLLTLIFWTRAYSQTDHLEPSESHFSSWNFSEEYKTKCRNILFQDLNHKFDIRVIVSPSFQKEYLLTVEKVNGEVSLILRQPSVKIGGTSNEVKITNIDKIVSVDTSFTNILKLAFKKIISKSRYSENTNACEADGTEFEFVTFVSGQGQITGRTWDCARNEKMKTLINIVNLLYKSCQESSFKNNRELIIKKCRFLLTR